MAVRRRDMGGFDTHSNSDTLGRKERFHRYFQEELTVIQEQISQLESFAFIGGEKQDAIDHCLAGIVRLSNQVSDAAEYIPTFDLRNYSQAVKALTDKLQETRSRITPKTRFSFKNSKKNASAVSVNEAAENATTQLLRRPGEDIERLHMSSMSIASTSPDLILSSEEENENPGELPQFGKNYDAEIAYSNVPGPVRKPSFSQASSVSLSNHTGLHIILPSSASHATSSGALKNLSRCIVDMSLPTSDGVPFAGLSMAKIKRSLVVAGQVAGAAHMTGVEDSVIVVTARQVRVHECKNVDIYLHCTSRPIIEDCSGIRFSPLPEHYITKSSLLASQNQWDQVDDFRWLKPEHSPNWSLLPAEERLDEGLWTTTLAGLPGMGLEDILNKMRVK